MRTQIAAREDAAELAEAVRRRRAETPSLTALESLRDSDAAATIRRYLDVPRDQGASPHIAVVGGVPPRDLWSDPRIDLLGEDDALAAGGFMEEYLRTLISTLRLVTANARLTFAPIRNPTPASQRGALTEVQVLENLRALGAAAPDVLLVTLGPLREPEQGALYESLAERGVVVVIAAGNEGPGTPLPFAGDPIRRRILYAASADANGRPAAFSQRDRDCVWAPGTSIPVLGGADSSAIGVRSGTAYSAALAAAVAGLVKAAHTDWSAQTVIAAPRDTARPVVADGVPVVNLAAALRFRPPEDR